MRRRSDDSGQLMMLAGIVLTISFILTSLTLAQVNSLEREAADAESSPILSEWRFLHDRLRSNLETAVNPETTNQSFNETLLPTIAATFRAVQAEKGYDLVIRKAGGAEYAPTGNEASLLNVAGTHYQEWSYDGSTRFAGPAVGETTDGILWELTCPETGTTPGCIGGIYLYVRLSDATTTIAESILFAVNRA